jgi:hypothetical protein
LEPDKTKLEWEKTDKAVQEKYQNQQVQDTISPTAAQLPYDTYYTRLDTIRNNSASATAGSIQADANVSARNDALRQQEWARLKAKADADAYAAGQAFGQNDPNFGALNYAGGSGAGYSGDWGGGGAQGVANVLRRAGFSEAQIPTMMAIAMAESSWNPSAVNDKNANGSVDRGLFQINSVHQGNSWYPTNPFDPLQSAIAAYNIYQSQGLNAWTVYKTGDYAKFIPSTIPPAIKAAASGQAAYNGGNYGPSSSSGLAGNAAAAQSFIQQTFGINNIGGFGGGSVSGSDHPKGKALDVMIANYKSSSGISQGNSVAQWFINNPAAFGTKYIIWRDQIWQNGSWTPYSHPSMNNDTGAHRDHVHISFL